MQTTVKFCCDEVYKLITAGLQQLYPKLEVTSQSTLTISIERDSRNSTVPFVTLTNIK